MPSRVPIDGRVLAKLCEDRYWSHKQLARQARAFAASQSETCAMSRTQVSGYEAARLDNPRSRYPSRENLRYLVGALRPTMDELSRLVGREPPRALAEWAVDAVKPPEQAGTAATKSENPPVDRREFVTKVPLAVAAHAAHPSDTDPLRAEIDALTGAYATTPPQQLLTRARRLLNKIVRTLREPMLPGARRRLLVDASEVAAVAGTMALFADHVGDADAYFTQAVKFATESGVDRALGCVLASAALQHGVDVGSGDSDTASGMLQAADRLLPREGLMTKVVVLGQAEELWTPDRRHEGLVVLERGEGIAATDDGEGFYARRGYCAHLTEAFWTGWVGRIEVRLGRADEGLARLRQWDSQPVVNMRTPAMRLADVALGHAVVGRDPEPACTAANRSLDASQAVGYRVGVDRVRRVREVMPPAWSDTPWVRALDERLRLRP
jgi:hypothetical protein